MAELTAGTRVRARCTLDHRLRRVLLLREPDTAFTIPARVTLGRTTITGHVYFDRAGVLCFSSARWHKTLGPED